MTQYIDRVDLVFKMDWDNDIQKWTLTDEDLDEITTITDAAPVVRCKDCVHAVYNDEDNGEVWYECMRLSQRLRRSNDFCSYGERRDDA